MLYLSRFSDRLYNAAVLNFLLETFATNKPSNKDNEKLEEV
jgi:hypothetical protein